MNRNQNSHFAKNPHANVQRSRFDISNTVKTTFNAGKLIPLEWWEILPGDTFDMNASILTRMQTLITPLMDDMYLDLYFFYVPNRLLWEHWQNFCGENDTPWFDETTYEVPQISFDMAPGADPENVTAAPKKGTVADYLGIPLNAPGTYSTAKPVKVNHLPFRAYCRIWNDWFRSENLQNLTAFNTLDADVTANNTSSAFYGGELLPVNRYRDYFSTCLPEPQRGPEVTIGVGDTAPVFTFDGLHSEAQLKYDSDIINPLRWHSNTNMPVGGTNYNIYGRAFNADPYPYLQTRATDANHPTETNPQGLAPANLVADISAATGISINELRLAFATQQYYEKLARSGSRYIELLDSIFGVQAPDQRLQRSEYLGGQRVGINISQVIQNSETGSTPLGETGAYSLTVDSQNCFIKSFVEHGVLMACACIRYPNTFQDGICREFFREDFFDYYNPVFKNIGEQPVLTREIFVDGSDNDNTVFGYNEAWAEYRYKNNRVSGEFRSRYAQSLDYWHLADNYTSRPSLSSSWLESDGDVVDRAIAVSQRVSDQFMLDIYFNCKATRPMPIYSIPGLDVL